jgi:PAS domain S-box-containing protein
VYAPALDAILRALGCRRASILLRDAAGTMRFVASRGLSEIYRRAVDGHSPWGPGAHDPQPICLPDIEAADLPDALRQAVRQEGIAALAFIPLTGRDGLLGKFMAYFDAPHTFADAEIDVALALARQLGLAIERMRADEARRGAERAAMQLAAIVESSDDAIYSEDNDGVITTWNRGAVRLFGYEAAEAIGRPVAMLIPPDRMDEELKIRARCRAGEGLHQHETMRLRRDGRRVDVSLTVSPMHDAHGRMIGVSKIARDITERKLEARAALHLASIVESSDDAILSKDLDGVITTWNKGAERLFGYTAAEAVGRPVTILIPPERLDEEPSILARIRRGEPIDHYETVRRRKDGSAIDISLTVSPMKDAGGRVVGASKIARDISETKQAEARLRDSERRLQELLAAIPAAIYTTDAHGMVTYFNETAVEFAGRTPVIGGDRWCVTWKMYRPDGTPLPPDQSPMALALREGRPIRGTEAVAERPDGTRVPFIPYPTPLRDDAGNVVGAINMLVDVSERKQAETQQRILLNELNHRVKNNMQMLQSLLYSSARQTQSAEAKKILAEASGRIAAMAAAQRVLYGTTGATRFSAREFLEAVCNTARQVMPADVRIVSDAASGEISNDTAVPLALILNELLTNAAKHGGDAYGQSTIRVGLTREADAFVLSVEDDGPGFDLPAVRGRASGLRLVEGLARQIRGHFEVVRAPAARCVLRFHRGDS